MKARNNRTGEIVTNFFMAKEFGTISYLDSSKTLRLAYAFDGEWTILEDENDDFSNSFDWQSFHAEAAKDILCAIISCPIIKNLKDDKGNLIPFDKFAATKVAIEYTNELVKQLKEKEEE